MASKGSLSKASVFSLAKNAGLEVERLSRDLDDGEIKKMISRNLELAESLTINGTPAFVIGDTIMRGVVDLPTLRSLVERVRETGFNKLL